MEGQIYWVFEIKQNETSPQMCCDGNNGGWCIVMKSKYRKKEANLYYN